MYAYANKLANDAIERTGYNGSKLTNKFHHKSHIQYAKLRLSNWKIIGTYIRFVLFVGIMMMMMRGDN